MTESDQRKGNSCLSLTAFCTASCADSLYSLRAWARAGSGETWRWDGRWERSSGRSVAFPEAQWPAHVEFVGSVVVSPLPYKKEEKENSYEGGKGL